MGEIKLFWYSLILMILMAQERLGKHLDCTLLDLFFWQTHRNMFFQCVALLAMCCIRNQKLHCIRNQKFSE